MVLQVLECHASSKPVSLENSVTQLTASLKEMHPEALPCHTFASLLTSLRRLFDLEELKVGDKLAA